MMCFISIVVVLSRRWAHDVFRSAHRLAGPPMGADVYHCVRRWAEPPIATCVSWSSRPTAATWERPLSRCRAPPASSSCRPPPARPPARPPACPPGHPRATHTHTHKWALAGGLANRLQGVAITIVVSTSCSLVGRPLGSARSVVADKWSRVRFPAGGFLPSRCFAPSRFDKTHSGNVVTDCRFDGATTNHHGPCSAMSSTAPRQRVPGLGF